MGEKVSLNSLQKKANKEVSDAGKKPKGLRYCIQKSRKVLKDLRSRSGCNGGLYSIG